MSKIFCPNCYSEFDIQPEQCKCGYPFNGSDMDRYNFMSGHMEKNNIIKEGINRAAYSRNILFAIGGLSLLVSFIFILTAEENTFNFISAIYSIILIGLGFYSYKEPFFRYTYRLNSFNFHLYLILSGKSNPVF
jgi:hypothetical protein